MATFERVCPPEVVCSLSDVNGDHKADLLRRDPSGVLGKAGALDIALSHGWGFGAFRRTTAECSKDHLCVVTPLPEQRRAGLFVLERTQGRLSLHDLVFEDEQSSGATNRVLAEQGVCGNPGDRCGAVQFDPDPSGDFAWLDAQGKLRIFGVVDSQPLVLDTPCGGKRSCRLGAFDDRPGLDLLVWTPGEPGTFLHDLRGAKAQPRTLPFDCSDGACTFADFDGDGRTDIRRPGQVRQMLEMWPAAARFEAMVTQPKSAHCGVGERCLWADINADRYADLLRIDPNGTVFVHPNFDARGRLEAATLDLSTLVTRQRAAEIADIDAFVTAEPGAPDASPTAMTESAFDARRRELEQRVERAIEELRRAIPAESAIESENDVARTEELALYIAVGRTVLAAAGLGASARADGCANVVLHEASAVDGVGRRSASYLFSYAQSLRTVDRPAQVAQMLDALSAITAGLRCLNHGEIAELDAAFADAVLLTAADLHDAGHEVAAKWLVDDSLPIVLLTFDAAKYASVPGSYRLLAARFDASGAHAGEFPSAGYDFAAAKANSGCDTFICRAYGHARRSVPEGRGLRLDRLGIWLPDPLRANRLRRIEVDAFEVLRNMRDLRIFGEGDCPLLEVVTHGFACRSRSTCAGGPPAGPEEARALPPVPGEAGDPLSHLLTERSDLPSSNGCRSSDGSSSGGGALMPDCAGPPLDSRRGRFSPDPELDTILRCAFESASAPVQTSFDIDQGCLVGQGGATKPPPSDPPTPEEVEADAQIIREKVANALRTDSPLRRRMVPALQEEYGLSESDTIDLLRRAADSVAAATDRDLPDDTPHPGAPGRRVLGTTLEGFNSRDNPDIHYDVEAHIAEFGRNAAGEIGRTLGDEAIHAWGLLAEGNPHRIPHDARREHAVSRRLGLYQQCADGPCDSSCSAGDEFSQRFTECVEPPPTTTVADVACQYAQDVCDDRRQGQMGGFPMGSGCAPSLPGSLTNRDCLVVQCGIDASPLAAACCSAGAPESAPPVLDIAFGPGPYPPPPNFDVFAHSWPSLAVSWEP